MSYLRYYRYKNVSDAEAAIPRAAFNSPSRLPRGDLDDAVPVPVARLRRRIDRLGLRVRLALNVRKHREDRARGRAGLVSPDECEDGADEAQERGEYD